ncbi:MAG: pyridoxamine 5'-phosphate oxidase family protein [Acidimicrobiaceae bacterium]|nr:pyridoxamine 5'-phosphate oxidase family protein [Acidimicrobiaceae bacterium]
MGLKGAELDEKTIQFISDQKVFFVSTAPLAAEGHINCSPKGGVGTFAVLDPKTIAYLDLTGSGSETIAHIKENGRIVIMWCSFDEIPKVARVHGTGKVFTIHDEEFVDYSKHFPVNVGARSIVLVEVNRVSTSCGYGVPRMDLIAERDDMQQWCDKKGPEGLIGYRQRKNATSIDGLEAFVSLM